MFVFMIKNVPMYTYNPSRMPLNNTTKLKRNNQNKHARTNPINLKRMAVKRDESAGLYSKTHTS